jgi:hypothetical protein
MKPKEIITIPRITGLALIIIAIIVQMKMQQLPQAIILAIAGLILALSPNKPAIKNFKDAIASFRLKKQFAIIMFIDAITAVALALLSGLLYKIIVSNAETLGAIKANPALTPENLVVYNELIRNFFLYSGIALLAFYLVALAVYALSRGFIWLYLLTKKPGLRFFARFGLVNLIWCTAWTALTLFFMVTIKPSGGAYLVIVIVLIYTHLTTALHYSYAKAQEMKKSFLEAFRKGFGKIGAFAQPYCYMLIIYVIISQVMRLVQGKFALAVAFICYFAYMAWYRTYMRNILEQIR